MKKLIFFLFLLVGFSQLANAQTAFGIKAGINYNSNSIKEVSSDVFEGAESKTGYHAGIWLRLKTPILGLYVKPELVYTNLENEVKYKFTGKMTSYSFQKIDLPILIGKKVFGIGNVYAAPSFQYILNSDFSFSDISDVKADGFTVGFQFGGGIELGNLGIDLRFERAFSAIESRFIGNTGSSVNFDTRINQVILGLSYRL
jgi:hypothetical protein